MIVLVELFLIIIIILLIILYIFYKKRTVNETGTSEFETGTSEFDTGSSVFETGTSEFETGTSEFETGTSEFETGTSEFETGTSEFETGSLGCINFEVSTIQMTDCLHTDHYSFNLETLTITFSALVLDNGMKVLQVSGTKEQQFHPQTVYFVKDKNNENVYAGDANWVYTDMRAPWYKSEDYEFLYGDKWNPDAEIRFDSTIPDFFNDNMVHETNCGEKLQRFYAIRLNNRLLCLYKYENSCSSVNGSSRTLYPLIRLNEQVQTVAYYPHVSMPAYKQHCGLYNVYEVYKDENNKFKLSVTLKYSIDDNWSHAWTYQGSKIGSFNDLLYMNLDVFDRWNGDYNRVGLTYSENEVEIPMKSPEYSYNNEITNMKTFNEINSTKNFVYYNTVFTVPTTSDYSGSDKYTMITHEFTIKQSLIENLPLNYETTDTCVMFTLTWNLGTKYNVVMANKVFERYYENEDEPYYDIGITDTKLKKMILDIMNG